MTTFLALAALLVAVVALVAARRAQRTATSLAKEVWWLRAQFAPAQAQPPLVDRAAPAAPVPAPQAASAPATPGPSAPAAPSAAGPAPPDRAPLPPRAPTAPEPSLEERLGARLPVWIGSIALALAGAFLVKYSLDQGWLSPAVRVGAGFAFGLVLLAAGERLRVSSARVSQGLSAAGIADLFACLLAAVLLYGLVPPALGFALAVAVTALAVLLSLRQGPMVALIGLVGGFLTPAWIRTEQPDARNLFSYLLLLEIALLATSRRRGWPGIALLATGAGLLWSFAWIAGPFQPGDAVWLEFFVLLTVAAAVAAALGGGALGTAGEPGGPGRLPALALGGGTALFGLLATSLVAYRTGYTPQEWTFFGILAAGLIVLGRIDRSFAELPWVAAAVGAVLLILWSGGTESPRHLAVTFALGSLFAVGGWLAAVVLPNAIRHRGAPRPGLWMSLSGAAAVVYFLIGFGVSRGRPYGVPWGALALALGAAYAAAAYLFARRRGPAAAESDAPLAAAAVAATAFVSLAAPIELERAWLAVAWALEVPVLAALAGRFRLPALTLLARALAVLALARLVANPAVLDYPIGEGRLINWLLFGYGVPLLALAGGAWLARQHGDGPTASGLELGALALAAVYLILEIGQLYHPGNPDAAPAVGQWGSWTVAWLLLGGGALALGQRSGYPGGHRALAAGGAVLVWLGLAATILAQGLIKNPLWTRSPVGETPVWNLLLWLFGAQALLLVAAAREACPPRDAPGRSEALRFPVSARLWRIAALGLSFVLVSLEVRQLFHGSALDTGGSSTAERWAYSFAWILFGTALLVAGILRRGRLLRFASLAVMTVAVLKVFLYDTANLTGLYRVGSLLGLGVTLLLLAHLYGRFVFREAR
jgi:uncharacterized membrane protein